MKCEEFIYRIRALTQETLNYNFDAVCKYLHIVLAGKAKDWYWRYHKQVNSIEWQPFCAALRHQYKDHRSDFHIREEIRNRKQKIGEQ